ncbi:hypothetical protein CLOM_g12959 [Closterium sp. NIES-68]|nr:hypothetical protein CLOM_g12959 [Closterium sp. NIES-68]GJP61152.1 hypothetical protein CLOP_g18351 [Closterium sp. NIES-67]
MKSPPSRGFGLGSLVSHGWAILGLKRNSSYNERFPGSGSSSSDWSSSFWLRYSLIAINACLVILVIIESSPFCVRPPGGGAGGLPEPASAKSWGSVARMRGLRQALPLLGLGSGEAARVDSGGSGGFPGGATEERICWTSSGDYSSPSGVVVHGPGCASCLRGQRCSFLVSISPPAHWIEPGQADRAQQDGQADGGNSSSSSGSSSSKHTWWQKDLTLLLRGPALAHGDVRCLDPPSCLDLSVSYRVWDIGEYWATLNVGCANLNFSAASKHHLTSTYHNSLTSWPISIHPRSRPNPPSLASEPNLANGLSLAAEPPHRASALPNLARWFGSSPLRTSLLGVPVTGGGLARSLEPERKLPLSPCDSVSVPGRWAKEEGGEGYSWSFFPCSPRELPPSEWISALDRRGIREISIVGDSHQRFLAAHLFYLLSGEDMEERERGKGVNENRVYIASDGSNKTLQINFYWIGGIYEDGEYGCSHPRILNRTGAFPTLSPTADVALFEAGYWAAVFCQAPLKALQKHLQTFLRWAASTVTPGKGRVVFRTIPSFPVGGEWCNSWHPGPSSNRAGMAINALLKRLVRRMGTGGGSSTGGHVEENCVADLDCSLQEMPGEEGQVPLSGLKLPGEEGQVPLSGLNLPGEEVQVPLSGLNLPGEEGEVQIRRGLSGGGGEGGGVEGNAHGVAGAGAAPAKAAAASPAETAAATAFAPSVLDLWMVDGPRYTGTGRRHDHHYSALLRAGRAGPMVVGGDVGEAHVRALLHYLLHVMP